MSPKPLRSRLVPDRRATRWDVHKENRRKAILEGALAAIEEHGPDVGVGEIAKRSGVTRAVVYRFFRDRADLDYQIRSYIADDVLSDAMPDFTVADTAESLIRGAIHTYLEWTQKHPHLHQFVGRSSSHGGSRGPDVAAGAKTTMALHASDMFASVLAAAGHETDVAEPLAFALVGLVDSAVNRWRRQKDQRVSAARLEDLLTQWVWQLIELNLGQHGITLSPNVPIAEVVRNPALFERAAQSPVK